jgi:hypothetical protein
MSADGNNLRCSFCGSERLKETGRVGNVIREGYRPIETICLECGQPTWQWDLSVAIPERRLPYG